MPEDLVVVEELVESVQRDPIGEKEPALEFTKHLTTFLVGGVLSLK